MQTHRPLLLSALVAILWLGTSSLALAGPVTAPPSAAKKPPKKAPQAQDVELPKDGREKPLPMGSGLSKNKAASRPSRRLAPDRPGAAAMPGAPKAPLLPPASDASARDSVDWWRVGFFSSVAVLAGLGLTLVTNLVRVADFQDRKDAILASYAPNDPRRAGGCDAAVAGSELDSVCESGARASTISNVLIGVTVGTAVISGLLAYKAFFSSSRREKQRAALETRVALESVGAALLPRGGALELRFRF